jgi:hypothetical protein
MPNICLLKFSDHTEARAAVRVLMQEGIAPSAIEAMSSQPIHGEAIVPQQRSTKLRTWALAGAALGLIGGVSLATITALNYPLVKGGMPIIAPWTVGLITYETTMLGAVLATFAGLLVELKLPNFKNLPYDPSVVDGGIVLAVSCAEEARGRVETAIGGSGASTVNWI